MKTFAKFSIIRGISCIKQQVRAVFLTHYTCALEIVISIDAALVSTQLKQTSTSIPTTKDNTKDKLHTHSFAQKKP
jgi:hypothetical protein